jgi:AcrR family transcriptional regulator
MPKKSERTRQRIVEAANRLFYHKGYNRTSFSDVVAAAGVPRGNIYYYFKAKDEILEAAIAYRIERISQMLESWNGSYRTPIERLHRFIDILGNSEEAIMRYGCPMGTLNTELGKDQDALQRQAEGLFRLFESWLSDQFAELGYAGRARELALRLLAMGQGISVMAHIHNDPGFLRREKTRLDRWVDQLAEGHEECA